MRCRYQAGAQRQFGLVDRDGISAGQIALAIVEGEAAIAVVREPARDDWLGCPGQPYPDEGFAGRRDVRSHPSPRIAACERPWEAGATSFRSEERRVGKAGVSTCR